MAEVTGMTPAKISQEITKEVGVLRSNVLADLSNKASTSYVDSGLSTKADATQVRSDLSKKADTTYVDSANTALVQRLDDIENRPPVMWIHHGSSEPVFSNFSRAKVNDIIERTSDDSQWRVGSNGLVKTRENFYNLDVSHRILNRNGETSGNARISRNGFVVYLVFDFPVPEDGPSPGRELFHLPGSLWSGSSIYWSPGYAGDDSNMYQSNSYVIYPGTTRQWVRRSLMWITNSTGASVTVAELLSPPPTP